MFDQLIDIDHVIILDQNDHRLLFFQATDSDISAPNNEVFYELEGDGFGVFSIDGSTGNVRALAPVRRNYSDTYRLSILARDRGQPSLRVI